VHTPHGATHPIPTYPIQATLRDGTQVTIRPIGPQDAQREQAFVRGLSPESRYFRFMNTLRELSPEMLDRFTHPDAAREIVLVALANEGTESKQVGVARCAARAEGNGCEFALVVADAWQGRGLGSRLMRELIAAARARGVRRIQGEVLASNLRMLELMHSLEFDIATAPEDARVRRVVKSLNGQQGNPSHAA
jgi:acetyltransferase